jgi:hypothetical protein
MEMCDLMRSMIFRLVRIVLIFNGVSLMPACPHDDQTASCMHDMYSEVHSTILHDAAVGI